MQSSTDYSQQLQALFAGGAGSSAELDIREFKDDLEAHDDELQQRHWAEMIASFQSAASQGTKLWGAPVVHRRCDDDDAKSWMERVQSYFVELVAWPRGDGNHFYVLITHEDRELPIQLMAGVTGSG